MPPFGILRLGADPESLGVALPHLLCEIFRANFTPFLSISLGSPGQFSQFSPDSSQA